MSCYIVYSITKKQLIREIAELLYDEAFVCEGHQWKKDRPIRLRGQRIVVSGIKETEVHVSQYPLDYLKKLYKKLDGLFYAEIPDSDCPVRLEIKE